MDESIGADSGEPREKERFGVVGEAAATLRPTRLFKVLMLCIGVLVLLGIGAAWLAYPKHGEIPFLLHIFLMDKETSVPTVFNFFLLLLCSLLLMIVTLRNGSHEADFRRHWAFLSVLFFMMGYDEAHSLHERLIAPLRALLHAKGLLYYTWVVPALGFLAVVALAYQRFLWALPRRHALLFVLAGAIYVGGAAGVEMPEGAYVQAYGGDNFGYQMITVLEETMEMVGLAVFAYALTAFLADGQDAIRITLYTR